MTMRFTTACFAFVMVLMPASGFAQKVLKTPKPGVVKETKVVYPDGRLFHHAGCPKIPAGTQGITREEAKLKKLHACPVCKKA